MGLPEGQREDGRGLERKRECVQFSRDPKLVWMVNTKRKKGKVIGDFRALPGY